MLRIKPRALFMLGKGSNHLAMSSALVMNRAKTVLKCLSNKV